MKVFLFAIFVTISGVEIPGEAVDGFSPLEMESMEACLNARDKFNTNIQNYTEMLRGMGFESATAECREVE